MSELEEFDLDRAVKRAWAAFQTRLADHLADMSDDDILIVELGGADHADGVAPYVQFKAWGGDLVRCEVSSNSYLDPQFALGPSGERILTDLGWNAPTFGLGEEPDSGSENFHLDLERSYADRLAAMTVRAFRDVWGVLHPAFLVTDALGDGPDLATGVAGQSEIEPPPTPEVSYPRDAEDLQRLVDETLTPLFGHPPQKDDDGDIPVSRGSALVFVRVRRDTPVVEVFAPLVRAISGRTRAAEVVADLNRRSLLIKFVLIDDAVLAVIPLPAMPFVPAHLRDMLSLMSETADNLDDDLAERLGGRLMFQDQQAVGESPTHLRSGDTETNDETSADETAPELLTLLHLDPHGDGSVDAETAAKVCGHDRDLILRFLRESSEQEIAWRESADTALAAGDREEADVCRHEAAAWERTVETLRGALRVVVGGSPSGPGSRRGWTQQQALFPDPSRPTLFDETEE